MTALEKEAQLLEKLARGETIDGPADMTDDYKDNLKHLMLMQADSELAGAFGYVPWIMKAISTKEMLTVSAIAHDEVRHARVMYQLLEELGVDIESRVKQFDYTLRVGDEIELGTTRAASDQRVNIFYYPIPTWYDFIMFNVLMDRGAGHQLQDATAEFLQAVARRDGRNHEGRGDAHRARRLLAEAVGTRSQAPRGHAGGARPLVPPRDERFRQAQQFAQPDLRQVWPEEARQPRGADDVCRGGVPRGGGGDARAAEVGRAGGLEPPALRRRGGGVSAMHNQPFDRSTTVAQILAANPALIGVFDKWGLHLVPSTAVAMNAPLFKAAAWHAIRDADTLLAELNQLRDVDPHHAPAEADSEPLGHA